jgi:hypothetical protein
MSIRVGGHGKGGICDKTNRNLNLDLDLTKATHTHTHTRTQTQTFVILHLPSISISFRLIPAHLPHLRLHHPLESRRCIPLLLPRPHLLHIPIQFPRHPKPTQRLAKVRLRGALLVGRQCGRHLSKVGSCGLDQGFHGCNDTGGGLAL